MMVTFARMAIAISAVFLIWAESADAAKVRQLKRVSVGSDGRVSLAFDGEVDPARIKTEFFNDIIQLSLPDVAVYPAKISSVDTADLRKIFAYQYSSDLTRARFTVKGKAEDFQKRLKITREGRILHVDFSSQVDAGAAISAAPMVSVVEALPAPAAAPMRSAPPEMRTESVPSIKKAEPLTTGKPLPSPWRAFAVLGTIILLLVGLAFLIRRARGDGVRSHKKFPRFAAGLMSRLGASSPEKKLAIQVLATHALGPKKSISVVRVAGRTLVLGITDEAINLISQIEEEDESAQDLLAESLPAPGAFGPAGDSTPDRSKGVGAVAAGPAVFSDIFRIESHKPTTQVPTVRSKIRSKLKGMKEL